MKIVYFLILYFFIVVKVFGQTTNNDRKDEFFAFIENSTGTSPLEFIGTFKCTGKKGDDIENLFYDIKIQAMNLYANCFKLKYFYRDTIEGTMTLILDTYYSDDSILNINYDRHEKNVVYVFCDNTFNKNTYTFKQNNINTLSKSGTYYKYAISKDGSVKIKKGGFNHSTFTVYWGKDIGKYFILSEKQKTKLTPEFNSSQNDKIGVKVNVNSEKLKYMDNDLGRLLVIILKQNN